jgi:hypothetical protein
MSMLDCEVFRGLLWITESERDVRRLPIRTLLDGVASMDLCASGSFLKLSGSLE